MDYEDPNYEEEDIAGGDIVNKEVSLDLSGIFFYFSFFQQFFRIEV